MDVFHVYPIVRFESAIHTELAPQKINKRKLNKILITNQYERQCIKLSLDFRDTISLICYAAVSDYINLHEFRSFIYEILTKGSTAIPIFSACPELG